MNFKARNVELYFRTLRYMKLSQVYYRIRKKLGFDCRINAVIKAETGKIHSIKPVPELDFDPVFLSRFIVSDLMSDKISFLHSEAKINWKDGYEIKDQSLLWNYNLHYFEYLFPLFNEYKRTNDRRYLKKASSLIKNWIRKNPIKEGGAGWAPYTIDLRLTNWLSFYSFAERDLSDSFKLTMRESILEQYRFLSRHIEKDILGNHYFEDLKTLVLCAIFFENQEMFDLAYGSFLKECHEEILEDGVHFELSPMYHNIILEGMIKLYVALSEYGYRSSELRIYIQSMIDAAWSIQGSLNRIPLFNDGGNNVAKSLDALVHAAETHLGIRPVFKRAFVVSGFYIFQYKDWKMIVDAGQPGPDYIPGHAHCDALSFELYKAGEPIITNCGTFAYQSKLRNSFRNTASHNTVMINETEQSQCWSTFRLAGRSSVHVIDIDKHRLVAELTDYRGQKCRRTITFEKQLIIMDESDGNSLTGFLHPLHPVCIDYSCDSMSTIRQMYAPDYGLATEIESVTYSGKNKIAFAMQLY